MKNKKILNQDELSFLIKKYKSKRKKIVLCHGVFDLLHLGHIKYFEEAKSFGDILVVTVTSDKYVNKGPNRPAFNEQNRTEAIAALGIVDFVAINHDLNAVPAIKKLKPNFYCKGPDYKNSNNDTSGEIFNEINAIKKIKGKVVYTKGETFSASKILNSLNNSHSTKQKNTLRQIKNKYTFKDIKKLFSKFEKLNVLVIGETIIDQYFFCEALGKSGKEPVLVLRDVKMEEYLGGAAAVSRHLSQFCKKITLLTMLGEKAEFLNKIKSDLPKKIKLDFIKKRNAPTILKQRFLDEISNNKVFGVYKINDEPLTEKNEETFNKKLKKLLKNHQLVIVSDYGHGFISDKSSKIIRKYSKYLALNAQVNAANIGYHSMRKYKNIECVIVNEKELRHEMRDKNGRIEILMKKFALKQKIKNLIVTQGKDGSIFYNKNKNRFCSCDAFAKESLDKVGAGDAMLSTIALCLKSGFSDELSLFSGSLAAAQSVETFANKDIVNKIKILKSIEHIVK